MSSGLQRQSGHSMQVVNNTESSSRSFLYYFRPTFSDYLSTIQFWRSSFRSCLKRSDCIFFRYFYSYYHFKLDPAGLCCRSRVIEVNNFEKVFYDTWRTHKLLQRSAIWYTALTFITALMADKLAIASPAPSGETHLLGNALLYIFISIFRTSFLFLREVITCFLLSSVVC